MRNIHIAISPFNSPLWPIINTLITVQCMLYPQFIFGHALHVLHILSVGLNTNWNAYTRSCMINDKFRFNIRFSRRLNLWNGKNSIYNWINVNAIFLRKKYFKNDKNTHSYMRFVIIYDMAIWTLYLISHL